MKFKHLLMSGLIALMAGFFVVGCEENPDDPTPSDRPDAPTDLEAVTLSSSSVGLKWVGAIPTGSKYMVTWTNGTDEGSVDVPEATSTTVTGLENGTEYTFAVTFVNSEGTSSLPTSINWAPASRFTNDAKTTGVIRIYEKDAPAGTGKGSGLILDPDLGGPRNESVASGELANIQLAANVSTNTFTIGPAHAPEFQSVYTNWEFFANNVQISDQYFETTGLDAWYSSGSLAGLFTTNSKNAFENIPNDLGGNGVAFAVRIGTGTSGVFRYARIFVAPDASGKLVRNDGHDYIVLHVSFQETTGVPYAKH